jgi:hypothetical protein
VKDKTVVCSACGALLEQNDRFCGECGQAVDKNQPAGGEGTAKGPSAAQHGFPEGPGEERKNRRVRAKALVITLIVLLTVGAGAWAGYEWLISRPLNIDTSQLLPQDGSGAQPQPGATQQQPGPDQTDKIVPGWLGVSAQDVPLDMASRIGMATPSGALVNGCEPGGPADRSGVLPGDVLLEMNGVQLVSAADLRQRTGQQTPGRAIQLVIWREGSVHRASVLIGERPPNIERQKRIEARRYPSAYEACFAQFCPGCNNPLDLFKEKTPECRQCEAAYKGQIENCVGR